MYIGFYNYYEIFNQNKMFENTNSPIGDNLLYPIFRLGNLLKNQGHQINTIDLDDIEKFDLIIFLDFPGIHNPYYQQLIKSKNQKLFLVIFESDIIKPDNWLLQNHEFFHKVFTWSDNLADGEKIIKYYWPNYIPEKSQIQLNRKKSKLIALIAGNKNNYDPRELYSERIKAIRWFEKNKPEDFDLYGIGWEKGSLRFIFKFLSQKSIFFRKVFNFLNQLKAFYTLFNKKFKSFKGKIESKNKILSQYKFSICYENGKDIPGYITEKIFDCFLAGCVPIYWGAPNITDFIPENTFIDKTKFNSYEELYQYLKNMPEDQYQKYLDNIELFLKSDSCYLFSVENFAKTIIQEIEKEPK